MENGKLGNGQFENVFQLLDYPMSEDSDASVCFPGDCIFDGKSCYIVDHYGYFSPRGKTSNFEIQALVGGGNTVVMKVINGDNVHYELYCYQSSIDYINKSRFENFENGAEIIIKIYSFKTLDEANEKRLANLQL